VSKRRMEMRPRCPKCGAPLIKNGRKKLKYRGEVQQWLCKRCGSQKRCTDFKGYLYPRRVIDTAVYLRIKGLKLADVQQSLERIFEITVKSLTTICNWVKSFVLLFSFVFRVASELLHVDETLLKTARKDEKLWLWVAKCPKTKLKIWHLSRERSEREAERFMWKIREHLPVSVLHWPKRIRSDSLKSYYPAIMKVFNREIEHERVKSFKEHSNNEIEEFFRCKHKFPRFRSMEAAKSFLESWFNEHNARIVRKLNREQLKMIEIKNFLSKFANTLRCFIMLILERTPHRRFI